MNKKKSVLKPQRQIDFCGFTYDFSQNIAHMPRNQMEAQVGICSSQPRTKQEKEIIEGHKAHYLCAFRIPPFYLKYSCRQLWQEILKRSRVLVQSHSYVEGTASRRKKKDRHRKTWATDATQQSVAIVKQGRKETN